MVSRRDVGEKGTNRARVMDASLLYESPFTDLVPRPDGRFTSTEVDELVAVLRQVREAALAA